MKKVAKVEQQGLSLKVDAARDITNEEAAVAVGGAAATTLYCRGGTSSGSRITTAVSSFSATPVLTIYNPW